MKRRLALALIGLVLLTYSVYSATQQVADGVTLNSRQYCFNQTQTKTVFEYAPCIENRIQCTDPPYNTSCTNVVIETNTTCIANSTLVTETITRCKDSEFTTTNDDATYSLAYGDWGKCSYSPGNASAIIICDSKRDGNGDGVCTSGESCIAFTITRNRVLRQVKNSQDDFTIQDKSFFLRKLQMEAEE